MSDIKKKSTKGKDPYVLFHNRMSIRRGFWLTSSNREMLEGMRGYSSDILHEALKKLFRDNIPKGDTHILCERIDRDKTTMTSLYIELEFDSKISDLANLGFKKQAIINYALNVYLEERQ